MAAPTPRDILYRSYGMTPKGESMPQTIEEWKHLVDLDEKVMRRDAETISKMKEKINKLEQKVARLQKDTV